MMIFKICHNVEWAAAQQGKVFRGSAKDKEDGFIHFSTTAQLANTLVRHFSGPGDLVLVAVDANALGRDLKWEKSRDDEDFPHLYADLPLSLVSWTCAIPRKPDGTFILPVQAFQKSDDAPSRAN